MLKGSKLVVGLKLGVNPPKVSGRNVSLMWLFSNIEKCKSVETSTEMFMLFLIGTLCVLT